MLETCAVCGREVGYRHTVHVVLNPGGEEGVVDHYVCRSCYEEELAPLFASGAAEAGEPAEASEGAGPSGASDEPRATGSPEADDGTDATRPPEGPADPDG